MLIESIKRNFALVLWAFSAGLIVAWLLEAWIQGLGVISRYAAPFALAINIIASFLMFRQKASR